MRLVAQIQAADLEQGKVQEFGKQTENIRTPNMEEAGTPGAACLDHPSQNLQRSTLFTNAISPPFFLIILCSKLARASQPPPADQPPSSELAHFLECFRREMPESKPGVQGHSGLADLVRSTLNGIQALLFAFLFQLYVRQPGISNARQPPVRETVSHISDKHRQLHGLHRMACFESICTSSEKCSEKRTQPEMAILGRPHSTNSLSPQRLCLDLPRSGFVFRAQ